MGWKIVEITNSEYLRLFLDNLVIYHENNKITIPIKDIDVLIINNYKINLSVQLINELTINNILTILCDNKMKPQSFIFPIFGNYNSLKIFESQLNWNHKFKSKLWTEIIIQKIKNQALFIKYYLNNEQKYSQVLEFSENVKSYDITNREGHASKVYWNTVYGKEFSRDDDSYINTVLNYGYTVLNGYISRSIIKKGLDPRISLFHRSFHNHFALSSDLIEPFRILIDIEVYQIINMNVIDLKKHKEQLVNSFNKKVMINNKLQFINNAIDIYMDTIINQQPFPFIDFFYDK